MSLVVIIVGMTTPGHEERDETLQPTCDQILRPPRWHASQVHGSDSRLLYLKVSLANESKMAMAL